MIRTKWNREKREFETFVIPAEEARAFYTPLADRFPCTQYCMSIDTYERWKLAGNAEGNWESNPGKSPGWDVPPQAIGWWNDREWFTSANKYEPCKYCNLRHLTAPNAFWKPQKVKCCAHTKRQYRRLSEYFVSNNMPIPEQWRAPSGQYFFDL